GNCSSYPVNSNASTVTGKIIRSGRNRPPSENTPSEGSNCQSGRDSTSDSTMIPPASQAIGTAHKHSAGATRDAISQHNTRSTIAHAQGDHSGNAVSYKNLALSQAVRTATHAANKISPTPIPFFAQPGTRRSSVQKS